MNLIVVHGQGGSSLLLKNLNSSPFLKNFTCDLGELCGPEATAASVLWVGASLPLPRWPQCATSGEGCTTTSCLLLSLCNNMPFLCSRLFWVSVMCWRLIPTSFMCVIELPSVWCFTLLVQNSRGRCCPSYACTSLLEQTVTVTTVVRPRLDFTSLDRFCILDCCIFEVNNSLMWILWQVAFRWPQYIWEYFCREPAQPQ